MTDEELQEIREMLKAVNVPKKVDWMKITGTIVTVAVLGAGIVTSFTTNSNAISQLQKDVGEVTEFAKQQDQDIQQIKLKAVQDSSDLKRVKEDVAEIKQDVKKLLQK